MNIKILVSLAVVIMVLRSQAQTANISDALINQGQLLDSVMYECSFNDPDFANLYAEKHDASQFDSIYIVFSDSTYTSMDSMLYFIERCHAEDGPLTMSIEGALGEGSIITWYSEIDLMGIVASSLTVNPTISKINYFVLIILESGAQQGFWIEVTNYINCGIYPSVAFQDSSYIVAENVPDLTGVVLVDLNDDGYLDLFISQLGGLHYRLNDQLGGFYDQISIETELIEIYHLLVQDLDGDNDMDFVTGGGFNNGNILLSYFANDGLLNFEEQDLLEGSNNINAPRYLRGYDLNADGNQKLIFSNSRDKSIGILSSDSDTLMFKDYTSTPSAYSAPSEIEVADLTGDGIPELVTIAYTSMDSVSLIYYSLNSSGEYQFNLIDHSEVLYGSPLIEVADIDFDGDLDILTQFRNDIGWAENLDGQGSFDSIKPVWSTDEESSYSLLLKLEQSEGVNTIYTANRELVFRSIEGVPGNFHTGYMHFEETIDFRGVNDYHAVSMGDLDQDGMQDVCIIDYLGEIIKIRYGRLPIYDLDGDGSYSDLDCDDSNALISPDATEIPYNNLDDDCDPFTLDDDLDEDGFELAEDCDDSDSAINPAAIEITDNGIDEDCDGMDLITAVHQISSTVIKIYPNPASEYIYIDINGPIDFMTFIYTLNGKLIHSSTNENKIGINSFSSGIYLLEIIDIQTNQKMIQRIVLDN